MSVVIGVVLVALGVACSPGSELEARLPRLDRGGATGGVGSMVALRRLLRGRVARLHAADLPRRSSPARSAPRTGSRASPSSSPTRLGFTVLLTALTVGIALARQRSLVVRLRRACRTCSASPAGCSSSPAPTSPTTAGTSCDRIGEEDAVVDRVTGWSNDDRGVGQRPRRRRGSASCSPSSWPPRAVVVATRRRAPRPCSLSSSPTPACEEVVRLGSRFGILAFHGGNLERGTDDIAAAAAERAGASLYVVRQPPDLRWHVPSVRVPARAPPPRARPLPRPRRAVAVAVHGYGREGMWTTLLARRSQPGAGLAARRPRCAPGSATASRSSTTSTTSRASCAASTPATR